VRGTVASHFETPIMSEISTLSGRAARASCRNTNKNGVLLNLIAVLTQALFLLLLGSKPKLNLLMSSAAAAVAPIQAFRETRRDRRVYTRHSGADLASIRSSRLQQGPAVALIDLSAGGALIEAGVPLKPGTSLSLVLAANGDAPSLVPMRVLRCEVAAVRPEGTLYRGACEFVRPLEWPSLVAEAMISEPVGPVAIAAARVAAPIRLDASLKLLAERCRGGGSDGSFKTADVLAVLNSLHARATSLDDQLARPLAELLPTIVSALERRDPVQAVLGAIEAQLRTALPRAEINLRDTVLPARSGAESIIFRPEQATDVPCVLNVQVPAGATLTDWQFRLLKASMHLCSLVGAAGSRRSTDPAPSLVQWQKIVVRYKDGRLVKGFSHDFNPERSQFAIWQSINAPQSEGMVVPLSGLKALFFVRDFEGDADYIEDQSFDGAAPGRRLEVTFFDSEVLVGTTLSYRPDGRGFFVRPADPRANNLRVFVVTSAVRHIRFLGGTSEAPPERPLQLVAS